jgi:DNA-binding beta-propeller fold protein YncE
VLPVNARTGVPGRPVRLPLTGGDIFGPITVTPDGRDVLAAEFLVGQRSREGVQVIRTASDRSGPLIRFGRTLYQPDAMLVTPASRTVFVLSHDGAGSGGDLLTPIRIATARAAKPLVLPIPQVAMAMTPNGRRIYLADYYDSTVTVVRTATNTIARRIHVNFAQSLAISPDGKTVYVGCSDPATGAPEIAVIATARDTVSRRILLGHDGGTVNAIGFTPAGRTAYAAINTTGGNFVVPISSATRTPGPPIPVGPNPSVIAIARYGSTMYVVNRNNQS